MRSICIDIGNSSTKVGLFNNHELLEVMRGISNAALVRLCNNHLDHKIIVSSVTSEFQHVFNLIESKERLTVLNHDLLIPINNLYKTPKSLGTDRLAVVIGAAATMAGQNLLVIQTGTCFTYDFIDKASNYYGGAISPGIEMRFKALEHFTAKLPLVNMDENFDLIIGGDTEESIKSGVINGSVAELEGIIDRYAAMHPDIKVVLTGGWTNYFESRINKAKFALHDLVLVGLNKILIHNNV
jgi:type III pantothenate kinase